MIISLEEVAKWIVFPPGRVTPERRSRFNLRAILFKRLVVRRIHIMNPSFFFHNHGTIVSQVLENLYFLSTLLMGRDHSQYIHLLQRSINLCVPF